MIPELESTASRGEDAPTVTVVGAGLAGLATAWELRRLGLRVAVLEREARVGGRLTGERVEGFELDATPAAVAPGDRALLSFVDALGLRDALLPLRPVVTARLNGGTVREIDARSLLGVARIPGLRARDALRVLRLPRLLRRYRACLPFEAPERAAPLDDRSLADFGRLYFGASVVHAWMAPYAGASLGDPACESRAHFLRRFAASGSERPGLPRGALAEIPRAAARALRIHTAAEAVRVEAPHGARPRVTFVAQGRERVVESAAVVVAVQSPDALRIAAPALAAAERDGLAGIRYAPSLGLVLALRWPLALHPLRIDFPASSPDDGFPLASALLEPGFAGGRAPAGRGLAVLRTSPAFAARFLEAPDDAVEKELVEAFADVAPDARGAVLFRRLFRAARAAPRFDVGHYRRIDRLHRVQRDERVRGRRLYLAGDYLVDPSLEGAVASAGRVARAVADDLARLR